MNHDFIVDYITPAGQDMHGAYKALDCATMRDAARWLFDALTAAGFLVTCITYLPGNRSMEELAALPAGKAPHCVPVYLNPAAAFGMERAARPS